MPQCDTLKKKVPNTDIMPQITHHVQVTWFSVWSNDNNNNHICLTHQKWPAPLIPATEVRTVITYHVCPRPLFHVQDHVESEVWKGGGVLSKITITHSFIPLWECWVNSGMAHKLSQSIPWFKTKSSQSLVLVKG